MNEVYVVFYEEDDNMERRINGIQTSLCCNTFDVLNMISPAITIHSIIQVTQTGKAWKYEIIMEFGRLKLTPIPESASP